MHYTQLFRNFREARELTIEELAKRARRHRNTVVNVESGRPVKFKTIAELMLKMGYPANSAELKSIALLWLEAVSGIPFSQTETEQSARKAVSGYRTTARQITRKLDDAIVQAGLNEEQVRLLIFAVRHPEALTILESIRDLVTELAAEDDGPMLKVAEDP